MMPTTAATTRTPRAASAIHQPMAGSTAFAERKTCLTCAIRPGFLAGVVAGSLAMRLRIRVQ